jgi:hypothetical protein
VRVPVSAGMQIIVAIACRVGVFVMFARIGHGLERVA